MQIEHQRILAVMPQIGKRVARNTHVIPAVADRRVRIALFIGQVAAEFADEDDLAVRKTRRTGFGAHHIIRCRGRDGIHALRRLEAEILREIAEGVHRVRNRVGEPVAAVNHLGGFAEQRSLPGDFSRPGPVGRHLVAAEVGADAVIPALLVPRLPLRLVGGRKILLVARVHGERGADLLQIVDAGGFRRGRARLLQRRQQHGRENRYDGDDDKEFDQGE